MKGHVGMTVWLFDSNVRRYVNSKIVYRAHFVPVQIDGETKQSWTLSYLGKTRRINKATGALAPAEYGLSSRVYWSASAVDDACWLDAHRYAIDRALMRCDSAAVLKEVARLLGVGVEP